MQLHSSTGLLWAEGIAGTDCDAFFLWQEMFSFALWSRRYHCRRSCNCKRDRCCGRSGDILLGASVVPRESESGELSDNLKLFIEHQHVNHKIHLVLFCILHILIVTW